MHADVTEFLIDLPEDRPRTGQSAGKKLPPPRGPGRAAELTERENAFLLCV